jgi:putative acetyltransferase
MTTVDVEIGREDPREPQVRALIAALDDHVAKLYPAESNHLLDVDTLARADVTFLVARRSGEAVGCGALRRHDARLGEVKRMFVAPAARGLGLGKRMLEAIEADARRQGLQQLALETGIHQPEAISLYRRAGFRECQAFGGYKPDPLSLFMVKELN